jgi:hypothetical protein
VGIEQRDFGLMDWVVFISKRVIFLPVHPLSTSIF